uniref:Uncharacterized protein n=1 Tax=Romanomermis culicivorax TaxID=13658 RepID=A0A915HNG1_ROMCU
CVTLNEVGSHVTLTELVISHIDGKTHTISHRKYGHDTANNSAKIRASASSNRHSSGDTISLTSKISAGVVAFGLKAGKTELAGFLRGVPENSVPPFSCPNVSSFLTLVTDTLTMSSQFPLQIAVAVFIDNPGSIKYNGVNDHNNIKCDVEADAESQ